MRRARVLRWAAVLAAAAAQAQGPPAIDAAALYQQHCAACHGTQRTGGMGPALLPESLERLRKTEAHKVIAGGRPATQMPGFADKLKADELAAIAHQRRPLVVDRQGQAAFGGLDRRRAARSGRPAGQGQRCAGDPQGQEGQSGQSESANGNPAHDDLRCLTRGRLPAWGSSADSVNGAMPKRARWRSGPFCKGI